LPRGWLFLRVSGSFEVAVPQDKVYRILHRLSEEYHAYAPSALALHRRFALEADTSLPGVLVVLNSGVCWHAGNASYGDDSALAFLTVSPDLFGGTRPWCRGILWSNERAVYIVDEERMEAAVA
jgi:hypothetical protein